MSRQTTPNELANSFANCCQTTSSKPVSPGKFLLRGDREKFFRLTGFLELMPGNSGYQTAGCVFEEGGIAGTVELAVAIASDRGDYRIEVNEGDWSLVLNSIDLPTPMACLFSVLGEPMCRLDTEYYTLPTR